MDLTFSPQATREISAIYDYIARESPAGAQKVVDRIHAVTRHVASFPDTGSRTKLPGVRVFPANPYPYLVYFKRVPNRHEVRILRIRHAARRRLAFHENARAFVR
ncbi:MAG TPA: type II toxin-antitoxin system RelE/ParE family toxin [Rhizomicrobium sp.]|jgi:plasmid stabilization system protein ParE